MKFATDRPYGDPEKAARKLVEIASSIEPAQEGRIFIELVNATFLYEHKASPAEYKAALKLAIARGWLVLHESGTDLKFTPAARRCSLDSQGLEASFRRSDTANQRSPAFDALSRRELHHQASKGRVHGARMANRYRDSALSRGGRGPIMHARVAILQAIHRNEARVFYPDRKDPHWGTRKLKRDE
jgi:hypothetical protein